MNTKNWPKANGEVIRSHVSTWLDSESDTLYGAQVEYKYSIGDTEYKGHRVTMSDGGSSFEDAARKVVDRYPRGNTVDVHYNPEKPDDSVLEPGVTWVTYLPLFLGLAMTTLAVGMLIAFWGEK